MGLSSETPGFRHQASKMGKFDGHFLMESSQNLAPCMMAIGMTEDMCKKMLDPKNETTMTLTENKDGSFSTVVKNTLCTELNSVSTFKIGETATLTEPWPYTMTVTQKSENVWVNRSEMGGKVMITETVSHNYGMSLRGTIEGTALSFSEEYKRVSPQVTGFYVYESEKNLREIVKLWAPEVDWVDFEKMKPNMAFRVVEKGDVLCVEERFSENIKTYSVKLDEEYNYSEPAWKIDDKRVTTKTAPGCFTTVCKANKDGKVSEYSMKFSDTGVDFVSKMGGVEATEYYKRVPDVEGTWRMVAQIGMENYLACLGITGSQAADMISRGSADYFTMSRQSGGKLKSLTNSKWFPAETVVKMGETYTLDMAGLGSIQVVMTEQKDTILHVMKFQGKKVAICEKITGDFMVTEHVVDGSKASTMKTIMARD